ncbi:hypothetical protein NKG94_13895 [Micromonospora sp. M12]
MTDQTATAKDHRLEPGGRRRPGHRHQGDHRRLHRQDRDPGRARDRQRGPVPSLIAANAAAGELPDVVGSVSLAGIRTLAGNELLHASANAEVVDKLGRQTFSPGAGAHLGRRQTALRAQRRVGPTARLPQGPVRRGRTARPDTYERITAAAAG